MDEMNSLHARIAAAIYEASDPLLLKTSTLDRLVDAVMTVIEDEAVNRMADQFVAESRMRALAIRDGTVHLEAMPAREIVAMWIGSARTMIGDAENYIEMDVQLADTGEGYTFHLSRKGKLTPHQARQRAEARAAELEAECARLRDELAEARGDG